MTPCQTCRTRHECVTSFNRCPKGTVDEGHQTLVDAQRDKLEAERNLPRCPACKGVPVLLYEPGSTYSACIHKRPDCPCLERVPEEDYRGLVKKIRKKQNSACKESRER